MPILGLEFLLTCLLMTKINSINTTHIKWVRTNHVFCQFQFWITFPSCIISCYFGHKQSSSCLCFGFYLWDLFLVSSPLMYLDSQTPFCGILTDSPPVVLCMRVCAPGAVFGHFVNAPIFNAGALSNQLRRLTSDSYISNSWSYYLSVANSTRFISETISGQYPHFKLLCSDLLQYTRPYLPLPSLPKKIVFISYSKYFSLIF